MDLVDLLRSPEAATPREPVPSDFLNRLDATFNDYTNAVARMTSGDYATTATRSKLATIRQVGSELVEVLRFSLQGQPARARARLDTCLNLVAPEINTLISVPIDSVALKVVYRMRAASLGAGIGRGGLFHIPFDLRHLVAPQRFSVIGVPMFYLGSTLFVCWEELGRPDLGQVWMSAVRLRPNKTVKVLNLAYRSDYMAQFLVDIGVPANPTPAADLVVAHAVTWPLLAASTFRVMNRSAAFKVEYVIPQLLMSWVAESPDFAGIRYASTHVVRPAASTAAAINYVFPAKQMATNGFCGVLRDLFEMTEPVAWAHLDNLGTITKPLYHMRTIAMIALTASYAMPYEATEFAYKESQLDLLPFGQVT